MRVCRYCGKECKNDNSHRCHERTCPKNSERKYVSHTVGVVAWNKGLTKDTSTSVRSISETYKRKCRTGEIVPHMKGKKHTEITKAKLSEAAKRNKLGGCRYSHKFIYKGIRLDSSYELILAQELDKHQVSWIRPKTLSWSDQLGKMHKYYPDLYLPDYDVYLDPKNDYLIDKVNKYYNLSERDRYNIVEAQNRVKIFILRKNELDWNTIKNIICT